MYMSKEESYFVSRAKDYTDLSLAISLTWSLLGRMSRLGIISFDLKCEVFKVLTSNWNLWYKCERETQNWIKNVLF